MPLASPVPPPLSPTAPFSSKRVVPVSPIPLLERQLPIDPLFPCLLVPFYEIYLRCFSSSALFCLIGPFSSRDPSFFFFLSPWRRFPASVNPSSRDCGLSPRPKVALETGTEGTSVSGLFFWFFKHSGILRVSRSRI